MGDEGEDVFPKDSCLDIEGFFGSEVGDLRDKSFSKDSGLDVDDWE